MAEAQDQPASPQLTGDTSGEETPHGSVTTLTPASAVTPLPRSPTSGSPQHLFGPLDDTPKADAGRPVVLPPPPAVSTSASPSSMHGSHTFTSASQTSIRAFHSSLSTSGSQLTSRSRANRSNSSLTADRPAPPSPASSRSNSRPPSTLYAVAPSGTASPDPSGYRDRSESSSSIRPGRRVSTSSSGTSSRHGNKARPRSALGASPLVPGGSDDMYRSGSQSLPDSSLASTPIPENSAMFSEPHRPEPPVKRSLPDIIVRDYAYAPTDERHRGVVIVDLGVDSKRSSKWFGSESDAASGSSRKGWGGFNLLGWRFGSRKRFSGVQEGAYMTGGTDQERDEEDERATNGEDDFVFDSDSSANGDMEVQHIIEGDISQDDEEPYGLYRAAFKFEAIGDNELGVEEGDLVHVSGRGGGDGWVIGVRKRVVGGKVVAIEGEDDSGVEGLVPEGYLEKALDLRLDAADGADYIFSFRADRGPGHMLDVPEDGDEDDDDDGDEDDDDDKTPGQSAFTRVSPSP